MPRHQHRLPNPLTNPFWLSSLFRRWPGMGVVYHLAKAVKWMGRVLR
jgi:hypothetical protein